MTTFATIEINPNLRFRDDATVVDLGEDVTGDVHVGDLVAVWERQSGMSGRGWVTEINPTEHEVRLVVDWANLKIEPRSAMRCLLHPVQNNFWTSLPVARSA